MKKTLLLCTLIGITTLVVGIVLGRASLPDSGVQSTADNTEEVDTKTTHLASSPSGLVLKPESHNFGLLNEGEARTIEFTVEGRKEGSLRFGRLFTPCPCITISTEKPTVMAGEPARVTVSIHSLTLHGKVTFPVYVELLEPEKTILRASILAEVKRVPANIMVIPESIHLGTLRDDRSAKIMVTNLMKTPLTLKGGHSSHSGLSIEGATTRIEPGAAVEVAITVSLKAMNPGPLRTFIEINTDCDTHALVRIPVDGTVLSIVPSAARQALVPSSAP